MATKKAGAESGRGIKKVDRAATVQVEMETGQGVVERHREALEQDKEAIEKGIMEEKRKTIKGKEGMRGTERRGSTGNIEEMWKRKRELMEGWGGKKVEEEMGIAKKGKIRGSLKKR